MWLIKTYGCVTYLAHMYSNSVIVVFVVNAICVRMLVGKVTVNDDALLFLSCPLLPSCCVLVYWSCACEWKERERDAERKSRVANRRGWSEGQASTHERERVERTGHHKDKKNAKNASKSNGRLFDALPLVVVRALFGDGDDVLLCASLLTLYFSFALFCAACNIWFVQSHNATYFSFPYSVLFPYSSFFFLYTTTNNNSTQWNNNLFSFVIIIIILQAYCTSVEIVINTHM